MHIVVELRSNVGPVKSLLNQKTRVLHIHVIKRYKENVCTHIFGTYKCTINCVISVIACNASGESDVKIECEGITPQISVNCSFNEGPLHPCKNILFYLLHT